MASPPRKMAVSAQSNYGRSYRLNKIEQLEKTMNISWRWEMKHMGGALNALLAMWIPAANAKQDTWFVCASSGNDGDDGQSWDSAKQTIPAAVDAAFACTHDS